MSNYAVTTHVPPEHISTWLATRGQDKSVLGHLINTGRVQFQHGAVLYTVDAPVDGETDYYNVNLNNLVV